MAERLPRARPTRAAVTDALTGDRRVAPVTRPTAQPQAPALANSDWDERMRSLCERVMATAAVGGDPKPLQRELEELMKVAPPGKREELENNRGKPPTTPTPSSAPKG